MISPDTTVADLVAERPARARLFERLGVDYCCGGRRTLAEECERRGLDLRTVVAVLDVDAEPASDEPDWRAEPLERLVDHIVSVHHAYLRRELPRLSELLSRCVRAHGADVPELVVARGAFETLRDELEQHIAEEEHELFPAILAGAEAPVAGFEDDHAQAGQLLERLSELTGGYDEGRARCATHRATLSGLAALERDVHEHIHEENNILFPRAAAGV